MRKGYWKTLLRRLRGRVASGLDTFTFRDIPLTLTQVLASDDDTLDSARELPLAATAGGAMLLIDTGNNMVMLRADDTAPGEPTGLDLPALIDALLTGTGATFDAGLSLGDVELLDLPKPARGSLPGD